MVAGSAHQLGGVPSKRSLRIFSLHGPRGTDEKNMVPPVGPLAGPFTG